MLDNLPWHQHTAFLLLASVLIEHGPQERDALRVRVATHGGQLGRDYVRFRDLGLVEEIESRPGVLRRLLGAKSKQLVHLTERGRFLAVTAIGQGEPAVGAAYSSE